MPDSSMLEKYITYLGVLQEKLDVYFQDQEESLKCKAGCDICCKDSYYPVSQLEYEYMKIGLNNNFTEKEREKINQAAVNIIKDRRIFAKTNPNLMEYSYICPFLVNGSCGIYKYRALICRSHGLIYKDVKIPNKNNVPHCMNLGLNYSNIYDEETRQFSTEKAEALGIKATPKVYDLSYSILMKESGGLDFGDVRMLVEWIVMDIPNYEELITEPTTV